MTARRGHPKQEPGGPVSAKRLTPARPRPPGASALTVQLTGEACGEELLAAFPGTGATEPITERNALAWPLGSSGGKA